MLIKNLFKRGILTLLTAVFLLMMSGLACAENSFDASALPAYSGSPYTIVNDNVPYFKPIDCVRFSYEWYNPLDALGRCTMVRASVGKDIMPTEKRGEIGSVKPTGWHSVKYDCVDGKSLYNRCHLIGFQLTGENANNRNLITGTRYMNVDGMLPFENLIADYVKETGNHVVYRVTPVFDGNNLVADGVLMEAKSIEDNGAGVLFNVFCYNVQPGIEIDYATGESRYIGEASTTSSSGGGSSVASVTIANNVTPGDLTTGTETAQTYVLNTNSKKFHYPSCSGVSTMSEKNKSIVTATHSELVSQGFTPCKQCNP